MHISQDQLQVRENHTIRSKKEPVGHGKRWRGVRVPFHEGLFFWLLFCVSVLFAASMIAEKGILVLSYPFWITSHRSMGFTARSNRYTFSVRTCWRRSEQSDFSNTNDPVHPSIPIWIHEGWTDEKVLLEVREGDVREEEAGGSVSGGVGSFEFDSVLDEVSYKLLMKHDSSSDSPVSA